MVKNDDGGGGGCGCGDANKYLCHFLDQCNKASVFGDIKLKLPYRTFFYITVCGEYEGPGYFRRQFSRFLRIH